MKKILSLLLLLGATAGLQQAWAQAPTTPATPTVSKVGVNTRTPNEVLDVYGTTRLQNLPQKGQANSIYTRPDGTASPNKDQTFNPTAIVVTDGSGVLGQTTTAPSSYFYMPAVFLPTDGKAAKAPVTYDTNTGVFTINLFNEYKEQYSLAGAAVKNPGATTLAVEPYSSNLDYFVTYYDNTVYESVSVNNSGVLTYKVKPNAFVTARTYMNIVLRLK